MICNIFRSLATVPRLIDICIKHIVVNFAGELIFYNYNKFEVIQKKFTVVVDCNLACDRSFDEIWIYHTSIIHIGNIFIMFFHKKIKVLTQGGRGRVLRGPTLKIDFFEFLDTREQKLPAIFFPSKI